MDAGAESCPATGAVHKTAAKKIPAMSPGNARGVAGLETLNDSVWFIAPSGLALRNASGSRKNARKNDKGLRRGARIAQSKCEPFYSVLSVQFILLSVDHS